jgi:cell fate (sporulation/competence/biofilm development) regulator YlbF (YheA/YmcA/DUF963 family)
MQCPRRTPHGNTNVQQQERSATAVCEHEAEILLDEGFRLLDPQFEEEQQDGENPTAKASTRIR